MKAKVYSMPYGLMVIWDKVEDASRYYVHLKIADYGAIGGREKPQNIVTIQDAKVVEIDRNEFIYTFDKLAYLSNTRYFDNSWGRGGVSYTIYYECKNYFVSIEAENKEGNIIDKSEDIIGLIEYGTNKEIDWRN